MPWIKGQSGNTSGRPKKRLPDGRTIAEAAMEHAELALLTLVQICQTAESEAARATAANSLLDRGFGKPTQAIVGDDDEDPIQLAIQRIELVAKSVV